MRPGTYYVPEGAARTMEVVGVREANEEAESFGFVDGSALFMLVRVEEAETDEPLLLKQFGASDLLLEGLHPRQLDPGQVVRVKRYEDGGYRVENMDVEDLSDAM